MKIKLRISGVEQDPVEVTTNLLCITEWERTENRKATDGRGIGVSDMVSWAFFMWKQSGRLVKENTWKEWLAAHPDMDIVAVDQTDPNPTDAAVSDAS